ncbi:MAG TPA: hypothetical protein VGN95_20595 [Pyrinomonadaceae bacterium]|jgi:hypothetical protein|nr:hypothetical protein [Pyrinomonadaceae bacterium]
MSTQNNSLDKVYAEASQWVRLANTVFWTVGTILVPISFGFVGLALNKSSSTQFTLVGKIFLGIGSVFLFSFWVYASSLYRHTSQKAREVLIKIEREWQVPKKMSFYERQGLIGKDLFKLQCFSLGMLIVVWFVIISFHF